VKELGYLPGDKGNHHSSDSGASAENRDRAAQSSTAGESIIDCIIFCYQLADRGLQAEIQERDVCTDLKDQNPCTVFGW
jgi:hypothetical protein